MRYIGNKTKLLSFIGDAIDQLRIPKGRALDAFAGTASVASFLKSSGFSVVACDLMAYSYVFQRAYVVADEYPRFEGLHADAEYRRSRVQPDFTAQVESRFGGQADLFREEPPATRPLEEVLVYLDSYLPPLESFITEHFSACSESDHGRRMYFTRQNGMRIDAIRHRIEEWRQAGSITEDEFYILLAALLEATDAVANTTGVYAAYVKSWQSNARRPLRLSVPPLVVATKRACEAHLGDVNALVGELGFLDLLYLDPPYNTRQYIAYYHVPELIATGWFDHEPQLRGKTGLIPDGHKKSVWSTRDGCVAALEELITKASARHVLMSYNSEGIISESEIARIFQSHGNPETYVRLARDYKRYRADSDSDVRQYKGDRVTEYLYYVRLE